MANRSKDSAVRCLGVALAFFLALGAAAATHAADPLAAATGMPPQGVPQTYTDPTHAFTLVYPPGVELLERPDRGDISLRSKQGYVLNIQIGAASPHVGLADMIGRLEARYLGEARPWRAKLGEAEAEVAGLPARSATYEGSGSRAQVVIARGAKTDFVFMFFAPPRAFEDLKVQFRQILAGFHPAPEEKPAPLPARSGPAPVPDASPVPSVETEAPVGRDANRFDGRALGYVIDYPIDWEVVRPSAYAVVFGGRDGTPAYPLSVSIQNVQPPRAATSAAAVKQVYESLKQQLKSDTWDTAYFGEGSYAYDRGGLHLEGLQFLVNYTDQGHRYKQLTVVLPRPDGSVAYIWSYRAPQDRFHSYWPIVENMLRTWTILGTQPQGATR